MKRWEFWTTDKCPCCLTISEKDTTHMFKCKNQDMKDFRDRVYTELYNKLSELDTSPHILEILKFSLQGNLSVMKTGCKEIDKVCENFRLIGQFNILNGLIPVGLCEIQHRYYTDQGSRKQGQSWGIKLVGYLMEIAFNVWNKRNSMEHNRVAHGLTEIENVRLSLEVDKQLRMGVRNVNRRDKYLFKYTKEKIWAQSGEWIRSWLTSVHIARNHMAQAKKEMNLSRGNLSYRKQRPNRQEIRLIMKRRKELLKRN